MSSTATQELSPMSKALDTSSYQSTPAAPSQTATPSETHRFSTDGFTDNGPQGLQLQEQPQERQQEQHYYRHREEPQLQIRVEVKEPSEAKASQDLDGTASQDQTQTESGTKKRRFGTPRGSKKGKQTATSGLAKSRVETQIGLSLTLAYPPEGIGRLHLPSHTISKPKLQLPSTFEMEPDILQLCVSLVCTSAMSGPELREKAMRRAATNPQRHLPPKNDDNDNSPQKGAEVRICENCMGREQKRAARKKSKNHAAEMAWSNDKEYRVVVFNTQELRHWERVSADDNPEMPHGSLTMTIPARIACYCRHHGEKLGFNLILTMKNTSGLVVAQAMSEPIMITDDHKTTPAASVTAQAQTQALAQAHAQAHAQLNDSMTFAPYIATGTSSPALSPAKPSMSAISPSQPQPGMILPRTQSRAASPSHGGPLKKRKSSSSRIYDGLAMTKLETSPAPSGPRSTAVSPYQAPTNSLPQPDMYGQPGAHGAFTTHPPTPTSMEQNPFGVGYHRSASMECVIRPHSYSNPPSNLASRAPSPNNLRNATTSQLSSQMGSTIPNGLASAHLEMGANQSQPQSRPYPIIHKVIPGEGPCMGGIEVTILGAGFVQGADVYFGAVKAVTTTYWGESSLVCLLPHSPSAGLVNVACLQGQSPQSISLVNGTGVFRYVNDTENQLMRLALQCVGGKTLGTDLDVSALARHVIDSFSSSQGGTQAGGMSGGSMYNTQASTGNIELQLLKCLDVIDLDDSPHPANLDRRSSTGHTMLHFASSLGFSRLVAGLLARGADPNALDNAHFTPLHMAAVHGQHEIARRLMLAGASPRMRNLSGDLPLDIAESGAVVRAIRFSERPARSRSETSLPSRVSSVSSLRSFFEPMVQVRTHDEPLFADPGEESPEYTSGDLDDEDPDEDNYLNMRRPSRPSVSGAERDGLAHFNRPQADRDEDLAYTANALGTAFKENVHQQLQQFQQSMALYMQNLPHLPHLPQIPQIPTLPGRTALPDYQAYLQQAPFMRRMTQYMPSMTGGRPDSPDRQGPKMDHRWWDLSSYMNNAAAPPPSYEEIFPQTQQDMDRKQASAVQAAADAEADMKCSELYDQASTSTEQEKQLEIPRVLKIGRKNAITKEQQEQFLRAREARLKRLSNDRNLFFIWVRSDLSGFYGYPSLISLMCRFHY